MNIKELIKRALFFVSVPKCVLCKEKLAYEDEGLCPKCLRIYNEHKLRNCPYCSHILSSCTCSYKELKNHGIKKYVKIFRYSKAEQAMPSNYLIYSLKQDNRADVLEFLSEELATAIKSSFSITDKFIVTNVPRRKGAIVKFGYDHAKELAQAVADILGVEYKALLKSESKKAQKSVLGAERQKNAKFDYNCPDDYTLKGRVVILIDDIVTTGASMSNCATLLRGLKPKEIIGASLGTAYKDKNVDFRHSFYNQ